MTRHHSRAAFGVLAAVVFVLGGCAAPSERVATARRPVVMREGAGGSWALVFNSPRTQSVLGDADPSAFREYARNDDALGYRPEGPVMASNEWPERALPDLYSARRVQLETRATELLYFDRGGRGRGR